MKRRQFIWSSAALSTALAGCQATAPGAGNDTTQVDCGDDVTRVSEVFTVRDGPLAGFELGLSSESVPLGGELKAELTNVSDEERISGNKRKFDIQANTPEGWQSIFWIPETDYWTDEGVSHEPGYGFQWDLTISQAALTNTQSRPPYFVCSSLDPRTYRFVYWGISSSAEGDSSSNGELALGREFTLTEN